MFEFEESFITDLTQDQLDDALESCPPLHELLTEEIAGILLDYAGLHGLSSTIDYPIVHRNYYVEVRCVILGLTKEEITHAFSAASSRRATLRDNRDILRQYGRDHGIPVWFRGIRRVVEMDEDAQHTDYKNQKRIARSYERNRAQDAYVRGVAKNYTAYMRRTL